MGTYRELRAWQAANAAALAIHRFADRHWSTPRAAVFDQLRRASLSVPLNIIEGYAHGPCSRCRFHFGIANASAAETLGLLEFMREMGMETGELIVLANHSRGLCFRLWYASRRYKGIKG